RAAPGVRDADEALRVLDHPAAHSPLGADARRVVEVPAPPATHPRLFVARACGSLARVSRQRPDKRHEQSGREYEQQYEGAEWPHWKLEELPSMGTRPLTRRPLAVGVDFSQCARFPRSAIPLLGDS